MPRVIVIGCGVAGYAVIRAFAEQDDVEIIAMTHTHGEMGCASRYVSTVVHCPHPGRNEAAFIKFLLEGGTRWKGALIIESGDYMAVALSKHRQELSKYYRLVTPEWEMLRRYIEKDQLYALADECGVPCPLTYSLTSPRETEEIADQVRYPCILKPVNSVAFVSHFGKKNISVGDQHALICEFKKCFDAGLNVVVQEVIPGPDSALERLQTYVDTNGRLSARFFNNKLRQNPPQFGVMRVGFSTARNPEVEVLAERLLKHGHYRGYASIEFKRDARDGKLKLMEVNVRMPRNGMLAIASGVNFPWHIYSDLVKNQQLYLEDYTFGLYWIELLPELLNMTANPYREKRYSWNEYMAPYRAKDKVFADFDRKDWKPFLRQVWNGLGRKS